MRNQYLIQEIDKEWAVSFVHAFHYSKILPRITKHYLGVFLEEDLVGVVTLGWGTQPLGTINKIFYADDLVTKDYIEIGKMCFSPRLNNNAFSGSQIMATLVKWIKRHTNYKFLYTLADGIMGKVGYVYQASNFTYIGNFWTSVYMDNKTREKIHPRSAKTLLEENAEWENKKKVFWLTHDFCEHKNISKINGLMFRYIYPLNKEAKLILDKYGEYKGLPNPKEHNLLFKKRVGKGKFADIEQPNFNMNTFTHNFQKY